MAEQLQPDVAHPSAAPGTADDRPPDARAKRARLVIGTAIGAVIAALVVVALAPVLVREAPASQPVFDMAAPLPGQGQKATQALRGMGYSCADPAETEGLVTRVCTKVKSTVSSRVELDVFSDSGAIKLARTSVDQSKRGGREHGDIAAALAQAVGLAQSDQEAMEKAAISGSGAVLNFSWGSFTRLRILTPRQSFGPPGGTRTLAAPRR